MFYRSWDFSFFVSESCRVSFPRAVPLPSLPPSPSPPPRLPRFVRATFKGQLGEGRRRSWHYSLEGFSRAASSAAMSVFFAAHDMQASRRRLVKRHASHPKEAIAYERRLSLTRHTTPGSGLVSAARDHNSFERETLTKNENERRRRPLLLRYK